MKYLPIFPVSIVNVGVHMWHVVVWSVTQSWYSPVRIVLLLPLRDIINIEHVTTVTTSCCLTGGVSSQVSVMLMRIVDKPIWFWVWYHPSLQRALKFVIILWFSFIRFKMLTFSIKISCKYLDYNKEMFCAYEIDIYHVPTSYSQTITVSWMLHFRGLILPLLTASDWHGEWRRWPEAELAWLRGLGPPP